ncbi:MAG: methylated-DNA--[protein]-cysteine S-methyltransferase [Nanobdellota archaeon]
MEYLAKGKRGVVYLTGYKGKKAVMKVRNRDSKAVSRLKIEADFLRKLNKHGIGPQLYEAGEDHLIEEYIKGELIGEFLEGAGRKRTIKILREVLLKLYRMDRLGINKEEMHHPVKHIIISKEARMIDFERCNHSQRPKNINQFIQFLLSRNIKPLLEKKGIFLETGFMRDLARRYMKDKDLIDNILTALETTEFRNKVFIECSRVKKGTTSSYKEIAERTGSSAISVGQALKKNPFPLVPCHRIIKEDGSIGGYKGSYDNSDEKKRILEKER